MRGNAALHLDTRATVVIQYRPFTGKVGYVFAAAIIK